MGARSEERPLGPALAEEAGLTGRKAQIVAGVIEGLTNREIAKRHHISASTVKSHLDRAYQIMKVQNRRQFYAELLRLAARSSSASPRE